MACDLEGDDSSVKKRMKKMLDEKKWTDIKFIVGEKPNLKVFEAHRNIISAASPVFEDACFGGLAEDKESVLISDIMPEAFKEVLQFIYTDRVSLNSVETACAILYAAEKYALANLTSRCIKFLLANICPDNVLYVLEHCCTLGSGKTEIVLKCMEHIHAALLRSEFIHVGEKTIHLIVNQEFLDIPSEVVVLDACVRWAEEHCKRDGLVPNSDNLKAKLGPAVRKLRFQSMTAQEMVGSSGFHKLLTYEEAYKFLANAVKPGTFPVPEDFSISIKKRAKEEETFKINFTARETANLDINKLSAAAISAPVVGASTQETDVSTPVAVASTPVGAVSTPVRVASTPLRAVSNQPGFSFSRNYCEGLGCIPKM